MIFFQNLGGAFNAAHGRAHCGVAYHSGKGWAVYDLSHPQGGVPEFLIIRGLQPIPLHDDANEVLASWIRSEGGLHGIR